MTARHVHITGASGSGVSTLGKALAAQCGYTHLDTDDFYWLPTDPPFQRKREINERLALLNSTLEAAETWVLSGSLMNWGDPLAENFDLVVFLYVPAEERMRRLRLREQERYGSAIQPGGSMHQHHQEFLEWAASYETGSKGGRSLAGTTSGLRGCPARFCG